MSESESESEYTIPMVVLDINGGPYPAEPFQAGMTFMQVWAWMQISQPEICAAMPVKLLPQVDLLAMHFSYTVTRNETHPENPAWAHVHLTRSTKTDLDGEFDDVAA